MGTVNNQTEVSDMSKIKNIVLKNPWIVDVFNQEIYKGDIAIAGDMILGVGSYSGEHEIDCKDMYVAPAFIDSHVHVESSKVIPEVYSRVLIKKGVTACIADPHEIANVLGAEGIRFMLDSIRKSVIDIYLMMPSCVPAVEFEDNGAVLDGEVLKGFMAQPEVLGLGEVMDVTAAINNKPDMVKKLNLFRDKIIDGHCPGASGRILDTYIYSGVRTDHECSTVDQALEEIRKGMYVMLREGSAARNLKDLLPAVNIKNFHRFLFCTDDRDISDIYREGSIDNNIRLSIKYGLDPCLAYTMASLNAAECYGLKNRGAVAPGYLADLVILKDLNSVDICGVYRRGKLYNEQENKENRSFSDTSMNLDKVREDVFKIKAESGKINVIGVKKGSIETERLRRDPVIEGNCVTGIISDDYIKIGVFERHKRTGKFAVGFIEGLGLHNCSIAQTIAHDSHNIIVVGDNDKDMELAVNRLIDIKGGIVIVSKGSIEEEFDLPVAGLMSCDNYINAIARLDKLDDIMKKHEKIEGINVFQTLAFMSLPVIPRIKITARGLYDFYESRFIGLFE